MAESRRLRDYLQTALSELLKTEAALEKNTEVISKLLARGGPKLGESFGLDGQSSFPGEAGADLLGSEEGPREQIIHPESRSKLAKQTEQEIIAAIEKCKMAALESKVELSRQQAENFDYRPEGMFPPVPKPMSKQQKLENIDKAYGPASKGSKPQPNRTNSSKPRSDSQRKQEHQNELPEKDNVKRAWNAGAQGSAAKLAGKMPPKPKPSESQYSNLRPVDPNRHLKRNPEKITSSSNTAKSSSLARSGSRGTPSKPASTSKLSNVDSTSTQATHSSSRIEPQEFSKPKLGPPQAEPAPMPHHKLQIPHQSPSPTKHQASTRPPEPKSPSPSKPNPLETALSIFSKMQSKNTPAGEGALGSSETKLLQLVARAKERANAVMAEYVSTKTAEAKRQGIQVAAHKMMARTALQTAQWEQWLAEAQGRAEDQEEDQPRYMPKLHRAIIDPQKLRTEQIQEAVDLVYCSSAEWNNLSENEELNKLYKFKKEGTMTKGSESHEDMLSLLQSAKGLKSAHGQDLLGDMYSIWYFSDQFVERYNRLKQLKAELEGLGRELKDKVLTKEVRAVVDKVVPLQDADYGRESEEASSPLQKVGVNSEEETRRFVNKSVQDYLQFVQSQFLPGLKAQLLSLRNSKDGWESPKYQRDLGAFMMQLQAVDKLMKLNSTLPLIFHQNTPAVAQEDANQ